MANDVIFKLAGDLSDERRESVLGLVKELPGVVAAAPIRRDSPSAAARQLCFARLEADVDAEKLAEAIQRFADVLYAEVPPKRTTGG